MTNLICLSDDKVSTGSSLVSKNNVEAENDKRKLKKKNKGKKVDKKEKRLKDDKAEKTKSKKFHRRLISLFCCCFKRNEIEQTTTENRTHFHSEDISF